MYVIYLSLICRKKESNEHEITAVLLEVLKAVVSGTAQEVHLISISA